MNKEENTNILDRKKEEISFSIDPSCKIMPHIRDTYSDTEIKELYDMYENTNNDYGLKLNVGREITGTIVGETEEDFLIDVGYKDHVRVEKRQDEFTSLLSYANEDGDVNLGTEVTALVTEVTESPYLIKGSMAAIAKNDAYDRLVEEATSIVVEAKILKWNPAGYTLDILYDGFKIPAFMPNTLAGINRLTPEKTQKLVGHKTNVMIESFSEHKGTFIVSRKKYLKSLIPDTLENIQMMDMEGNPTSYVGEVTGSTDFGIFVEFEDCLTGMIHKDNLNEEYIAKLANKSISAGSKIEFHIKEILRGKLILTQVWRETLWDTINIDDEFDSTIKDFKKFGALVRLDEETVGLVHNSELEKSGKNYEIDDTLKVKVISVQRMERKIYLSVI